MLGIRQPLDGPIFDILEDAENWCMYAMTDQFDRMPRYIHSRASLISGRRLIQSGCVKPSVSSLKWPSNGVRREAPAGNELASEGHIREFR